MKQEFKQTKLAAILFIVAGLLFGANVFMQMSMEDKHTTTIYLYEFDSVLFLVLGIFSFNKSYIIIEDGNMIVNPGVFNKKKTPISDIERIDFSDKKRVEILMKDKPMISIKLGMLEKRSKEEFVNYMMEVNNKLTK